MLRTVLAMMAGLAAMVLVIMLVEAAGMQMYPPPPGIDLSRPDSMGRLVGQLPTGALVFVLVAWVLGALTGGWVAARIARRGGYPLLAALAMGGFVLAGVVAMIASVPHPRWLSVAGLLLPIPAAWLGARLAGRRRRHGLPPPDDSR